MRLRWVVFEAETYPPVDVAIHPILLAKYLSLLRVRATHK